MTGGVPNPADQAREIAETLASMSRTADAYLSAHLEELRPDQQDFLTDLIRQLDDAHDRFTGAAIHETIAGLRDDLSDIASVTRSANEALSHLKTVSAVLKLAAGIAELCADIATADFGAIPAALANIAAAIPRAKPEAREPQPESGTI
jgi:hypothetical protein